MNNSIVLVLIACSYFVANDAFIIEPRIVDGQKAEIGQFPYYAFLIIHFTGTIKHAYCGASLISDEWLVTAGHCIAGVRSVDVLLAETNLIDFEPEHVRIFVPKSGFYIHPEYYPPLALNDIALIHLPRKIEFSAHIQPVNLPSDCTVPKSVDAIAIGHGGTNNHSGISSQLNYARLKTTSQDLCRKVFPIVADRESVLCAMNSERTQSVCKGDSGGPLVTASNQTLIGIACFVKQEGCETGSPQGFTNVYSYLNWIRTVMSLKLPHC